MYDSLPPSVLISNYLRQSPIAFEIKVSCEELLKVFNTNQNVSWEECARETREAIKGIFDSRGSLASINIYRIGNASEASGTNTNYTGGTTFIK